MPPRALPVARLTSPMNPAPGVTVALLPGSHPDLYVQNSGARTVTVLGQQGEPFAQIGPHGVQVNLRSPIHAADASARGQSPEASANPAARPLWRRVSAPAPTTGLILARGWRAIGACRSWSAAERVAITGTLSTSPPLARAADLRSARCRDVSVAGLAAARPLRAAAGCFRWRSSPRCSRPSERWCSAAARFELDSPVTFAYTSRRERAESAALAI